VLQETVPIPLVSDSSLDKCVQYLGSNTRDCTRLETGNQ
jgi:hypothetical protein